MGKTSFDYPLMQPPLDVPYSELTLEQAGRNFEWFVEQVPSRLALLRKLYNQEMGRQDLDCTFESLVPLWVWMRTHVGTTGKNRMIELKRPPGAVKGPPILIDAGADWTITTLALVRDAGIYVAETFMRRYPFLQWALSKSRSKQSDMYGRPVLVGLTFVFEPRGKPKPIEFNPEQQANTCVAGYFSGDAKDKADEGLLNVYKTWREDAEKSRP